MLDILGDVESLDYLTQRIRKMIDKRREEMNTESVYVLQKGNDRVSLTDHDSLLALANTMMVFGLLAPGAVR